jgi:hypothetical protein
VVQPASVRQISLCGRQSHSKSGLDSFCASDEHSYSTDTML